MKKCVALFISLKYNYFQNASEELPRPSVFLFDVQYLYCKGEVTELVPVPDFKSAVSWLWSGKVSSILMLSRQFPVQQ
jgi:hypothetical protein